MLKVLSLLPLAQILSPLSAPNLPASLASTEPVSSTFPAPITVSSDPFSGTPIALPDTPPLPETVPQRSDIVRSQQVRPLPGQLDDVPVFNSNSPELIQKDGILLSTFPPEGMQVRSAHLNHPLQGRFDIFAHHVARGINADDVRTLYVGVVVYNPADRPIKLDILQGVTYLSQEAPFNDLPAYVANPMGTVFAGPGSRVMNDVLRGERQYQWPSHVTIPAKSAQLLVNVPIPLRRLTVATNGTLPPGSIIPGFPTTIAQPQLDTQSTASAVTLASTRNATNPVGAASPASPPPPSRPPVNDNRPVPINGRTILMRLSSSGPVYVASLAMYAPRTPTGDERVPSLSEWVQLLRTSDVSGPRDRQPTPPDTRFVPRFYYGRVAGVAQGSQWTARVTDKPDVDYLSIPQPGEAISYVISSVDRNTFGTGQIQSAPMLVRYPDTAYRAHGNYGILYNITLPLRNDTDSPQRVAIMLQTPLQDERLKGEALRFRNPPYDQIFFRGTIRLRYTDDLGIRQTRYMHLVQRRGQQGQPLIRLTLPRGQRRQVEVQFLYPPDSTPPQVLTIETQSYNGVVQEPNAPTRSRSEAEIERSIANAP
ncbi:DUF3370 domain-containing protein [Leptolyngbya sp. NK1-12]|uniref:DUF3370 domain-containing protein n=1 Tax=Leptolyngbya sp. NK1-12 TaxID=2547451 RepID=A0AA96WFR0_9CYAN|nr:DUF3370 domain-containing protein [Leptolyngbya sp. NK1-12]WNZ23780.1 DUF3370 domain-containing protein [Leptolyngbya sp. NK1-12]